MFRSAIFLIFLFGLVCFVWLYSFGLLFIYLHASEYVDDCSEYLTRFLTIERVNYSNNFISFSFRCRWSPSVYNLAIGRFSIRSARLQNVSISTWNRWADCPLRILGEENDWNKTFCIIALQNRLTFIYWSCSLVDDNVATMRGNETIMFA